MGACGHHVVINGHAEQRHRQGQHVQQQGETENLPGENPETGHDRLEPTASSLGLAFQKREEESGSLGPAPFQTNHRGGFTVEDSDAALVFLPQDHHGRPMIRDEQNRQQAGSMAASVVRKEQLEKFSIPMMLRKPVRSRVSAKCGRASATPRGWPRQPRAVSSSIDQNLAGAGI